MAVDEATLCLTARSTWMATHDPMTIMPLSTTAELTSANFRARLSRGHQIPTTRPHALAACILTSRHLFSADRFLPGAHERIIARSERSSRAQSLVVSPTNV